jgi:hypothetical protein
MAARLVRPSVRHARSYVAALREAFRRGAQEIVSERRIRQIEEDFAAYVAAITDQTGRIRLPSGEILPKGAVLRLLADRGRRVHRRGQRAA